MSHQQRLHPLVLPLLGDITAEIVSYPEQKKNVGFKKKKSETDNSPGEQRHEKAT